VFVLGTGLSTSLYLARRPAVQGVVTLGYGSEPRPTPIVQSTENPYRQPGSDG
jgi:hypothetical protein